MVVKVVVYKTARSAQKLEVPGRPRPQLVAGHGNTLVMYPLQTRKALNSTVQTLFVTLDAWISYIHDVSMWNLACRMKCKSGHNSISLHYCN